jgi:hypothetical protein
MTVVSSVRPMPPTLVGGYLWRAVVENGAVPLPVPPFVVIVYKPTLEATAVGMEVEVEVEAALNMLVGKAGLFWGF